jgi:hypothetical protein
VVAVSFSIWFQEACDHEIDVVIILIPLKVIVAFSRMHTVLYFEKQYFIN